MDTTVRHGIEATVYAGRRLDRAEGVALLGADDLLWLGRLAHRRRCAAGDDRVWFALDEHRRDGAGATGGPIVSDGVAELRYGLRERPEELVDRLLSLRERRDDAGVPSAVVVVRHRPDRDDAGPALVDSLRVFAVARLLLDDVPHLRCDLGTHDDAVAQFGLQFGVDDLGDPAGEGRCAALVDLIREAGFRPVRRDADYRVSREWDAPPPFAERRAEPQRIWA